MKFKDRLKDLRQTKALTQSDLANAIQSTKQAISQYERGIRRPDFETLNALCDFFNVSTDYLLGKSDVTLRFVDTEGLKALEENIKTLRQDQKDLLADFETLTADQQDAVRNIIKHIA